VKKEKIAVVGLGYVGLPLALAAAEAGFNVVGVDNNSIKVSEINSGKSLIEDISDSQIRKLVSKGSFVATVEFAEIRDAKTVLICVPTPLNSEHKPDISALEFAAKSIAPNLNRDVLVVLESTVATSTTRNFLLPILIKGSGLGSKDINIAFSPERTDPTNKKWNLQNTPKIVSGINKISTEKAIKFYKEFVDSVEECESIEVAETAKLLENSFRLVNISFINELASFCQKLEIDINQVIKAAATKPYGFMPFYPSIGVGGHCIPVDPLYLANKAREIGAPTRFIDLADQINQERPDYFVGRAEEKLGGLKGMKVLVVGVSYKPNVADIRETPVEALILGLKQKGAQVVWHDDLVQEWNGEKSVALSSEFDLAIIATPHEYLDLTRLGNVPILNTRGSI
jgi:UDP-N-acetyl-D-glucosamine dehydrogenase